MLAYNDSQRQLERFDGHTKCLFFTSYVLNISRFINCITKEVLKVDRLEYDTYD